MKFLDPSQTYSLAEKRKYQALGIDYPYSVTNEQDVETFRGSKTAAERYANANGGTVGQVFWDSPEGVKERKPVRYVHPQTELELK